MVHTDSHTCRLANDQKNQCIYTSLFFLLTNLSIITRTSAYGICMFFLHISEERSDYNNKLAYIIIP